MPHSCFLGGLFLFFKDFIYLFLDRGEGREKEVERNIKMWLPLACPPLGTQPATQACALTWNQTGYASVHSLALYPQSNTIQGSHWCFLKWLFELFFWQCLYLQFFSLTHIKIVMFLLSHFFFIFPFVLVLCDIWLNSYFLLKGQFGWQKWFFCICIQWYFLSGLLCLGWWHFTSHSSCSPRS